jgi:hypothetical protein
MKKKKLKKYIPNIIPPLSLTRNDDESCILYSLCPYKNCDKEEKDINEPRDRCLMLERGLYNEFILNPFPELIDYRSPFLKK